MTDDRHKNETPRPAAPTTGGVTLELFASGGIAGAGLAAVLVELVRGDGSFLAFVGLGMTLAGVPLFVRGLVRYFRQLTRKLDEARATYHSLVESSRDGILIFRDDHLLFANHAAARLVGYDTLEDFLATPLSKLIAPEHLDLVRERHLRRMKGEDLPGQYEIAVMHRDGHRVPVELMPTVIDYKGQRASQTVIRDLTRRRELEARLHQSTRVAAIGELASGIAHQLNNPMIGILNMAQLLAEKVPQDDPRRKLVDAIVRAGEDASLTIRNLLRFSREPRHGRERLDVVRLVRDVLTISGQKLGHDNIRVTIDVVPDFDATVMGNANALGQVLLNLLQNAQHALVRDGEITIRIEPFFEEDERLVALRVKDSGPGIPPDVMPRIFEPFFTTKPREQGTGLGLSLARQIVHQHGGRIWACSEPGQGAEFSVLLPAVVRAGDEEEADDGSPR
jgi:PAS domain S-box-containing protein